MKLFLFTENNTLSPINDILNNIRLLKLTSIEKYNIYFDNIYGSERDIDDEFFEKLNTIKNNNLSFSVYRRKSDLYKLCNSFYNIVNILNNPSIVVNDEYKRRYITFQNIIGTHFEELEWLSLGGGYESILSLIFNKSYDDNNQDIIIESLRRLIHISPVLLNLIRILYSSLSVDRIKDPTYIWFDYYKKLYHDSDDELYNDFGELLYSTYNIFCNFMKFDEFLSFTNMVNCNNIKDINLAYKCYNRIKKMR